MRKLAIGFILGLLIFGGFVNHCQAAEPLFSGAGIISADSMVNQICEADFDGDGQQEYALVESLANRIELADYLPGNSMYIVTNFYASGWPYLLSPADINGDGRVDLAYVRALNNHIILVYEGFGNNMFRLFASINSNRSEAISNLYAADIDVDGDSDFVFLEGRIGISLNTGNGFGSPIFLSDSIAPSFIALEDFDNDSDLDILVTYGQRKIIRILLNNGLGSFSDGPIANLIYTPTYGIPADLNNDGLADMVIGNNSAYFTILINTGSQFLPPADIDCFHIPTSLSCGDYDGDDDLDIVVSSNSSDSVYLFANTGNGTFIQNHSYNLGFKSRNILLSDFDNDNDCDIISANSENRNITFLYNNGDGSFVDIADYPAPGQPRSIISANLDGDSLPDLAVAAYLSDSVLIYYNDGEGNFRAPISIYAGAGPRAVLSGDFNGDINNDLAVANYDNNEISILVNDDSGNIYRTASYQVSNAPVALAIADFDESNGLDIAVSCYWGHCIELLANNGNNGFQLFQAIDCNPYPVPIGNADFDLDGDEDIVYGCYGSGVGIEVIHNDNPNGFTNLTAVNDNDYFSSLCVTDINNDDYPDIVAVAYPDQLMIFMAAGNFQFSNIANYTVGYKPFSVRSADFDSDGDQDLVVADTARSCVTVMLNDDTGAFGHFQNYAVGSQPTSMAVGDFNNDGFPDLAVSNKESDNITVLLNRTQVNKIPDHTPSPTKFNLSAYPNPFNSNAIISFNQPQPGQATLTIYDILGRQVETIYDGYLSSGNRDFTWRADKYPSGIYFALLQSPEIAESVKLTLIK